MGEQPPGLYSNATPHHTPTYFLIESFISAPVTTPTTAESLVTPPIETATDATTVAFSPKTDTHRIRTVGYHSLFNSGGAVLQYRNLNLASGWFLSPSISKVTFFFSFLLILPPRLAYP